MAGTKRKRRTQAERSALSEKRILQAAERLIAQRGFTRTTLAQVGTAAGYTGALVSQRYGSKEGLLRALLKRIDERFESDQLRTAVGDRSGLDALETSVQVYLNELRVREERMRLLYVLMGEGLGRGNQGMAVVREGIDRIRQTLEEAIRSSAEEAGTLDEIDVASEARLVQGALSGTALMWLLSPALFNLDRLSLIIRKMIRWRVQERFIPKKTRQAPTGTNPCAG